MELLALGLPRRMFCWSATLELAAFALAAAVAAGLLRRGQPLWRAAGMAAGQGDDVPRASCACCGPVWFAAAQAAVVAVAAVLAVWIALDYAFDGVGRQATILATLRVGRPPGEHPGAADAAGHGDPDGGGRELLPGGRGGNTPPSGCLPCWARRRAGPCCPGRPAPWLHRSVVAMTAAAVAVFVASFALRTFLPAESDWIERGKRSVLPLAAAAATALAAVLIGEGVQTAQFRRHGDDALGHRPGRRGAGGPGSREHRPGRLAATGPLGTRRPPAADLRLCSGGHPRLAGAARPLHHALAIPWFLPAPTGCWW